MFREILFYKFEVYSGLPMFHLLVDTEYIFKALNNLDNNCGGSKLGLRYLQNVPFLIELNIWKSYWSDIFKRENRSFKYLFAE